jgi:hypothetical protein
MNGYKRYWQKKKAVQALNFNIALQRVKNGLEVSDLKLEELKRKRLLSVRQITIIKQKRDKRGDKA